MLPQLMPLLWVISSLAVLILYYELMFLYFYKNKDELSDDFIKIYYNSKSTFMW